MVANALADFFDFMPCALDALPSEERHGIGGRERGQFFFATARQQMTMALQAAWQ